jgi:hypothetical protein
VWSVTRAQRPASSLQPPCLVTERQHLGPPRIARVERRCEPRRERASVRLYMSRILIAHPARLTGRLQHEFAVVVRGRGLIATKAFRKHAFVVAHRAAATGGRAWLRVVVVRHVTALSIQNATSLPEARGRRRTVPMPTWESLLYLNGTSDRASFR